MIERLGVAASLLLGLLLGIVLVVFSAATALAMGIVPR
jgi:hypothetical protein